MKENKNKINETLDQLVGFKLIKIFSNLFCTCLFFGLCYFAFAGFSGVILQNYFQYVVSAFIIVFCFREGIKHVSNLPSLFVIPIVGLILYFVLLTMGYKTPLLSISITISSLLLIASIVYRFYFRKYLIRKFPTSQGQKYS